MSTLTASSFKPVPEVLAVNVSFNDDHMIVDLSDGRVISVPLVWFPRLFDATREQRANYRLIADGEGISWESIDEDLSVAGLLRGTH